MAAQIVLTCLGTMCIASGGFVGGLTWTAREIGASGHRAAGMTCCAGLGALGLVCLIAGASV